MNHVKRTDRTPQPVSAEGAVGVKAVGLITEDDGSPTSAMRIFEIEPGGNTPWHSHEWEHVVYCLEGQGKLKTEHGEADFEAGDALLTEPNELHNFVNTGDTTLRFLCIVPLRGNR